MENFSVFIAHHLGLFYLFASTLVALMLLEFLRTKRTKVQVGPVEAVTLINRQNAIVIDIRPNEDYKTGHIIDAVSSPSLNLAEAVKKLDKYKNKTLLIICQNGTESQKTAAALTGAGFTAFALSGGLSTWSNADLPLVKE